MKVYERRSLRYRIYIEVLGLWDPIRLDPFLWVVIFKIEITFLSRLSSLFTSLLIQRAHPFLISSLYVHLSSQVFFQVKESYV